MGPAQPIRPRNTFGVRVLCLVGVGLALAAGLTAKAGANGDGGLKGTRTSARMGSVNGEQFVDAAARARTAQDQSSCQTSGQRVLSRSVDLSVLRQPLAQLVNLLVEQAGSTAVIDEGVNPTIENIGLSGTLGSALDALGRRADLVWWWNGAEIRIAARSSNTTRSVEFPGGDALKREAAALCLPADVVTFRGARVGGLVRLTGPRAAVSEIADLADRLRERYGRVTLTRYGRSTTETINR